MAILRSFPSKLHRNDVGACPTNALGERGMGRFRGPMTRVMGWLRIIGVLVVAVCVHGCARNWARPNADVADLAREKFECQFEATKAVVATGTEAEKAEARRGEFESLCMEAKGWSRSWGR